MPAPQIQAEFPRATRRRVLSHVTVNFGYLARRCHSLSPAEHAGIQAVFVLKHELQYATTHTPRHLYNCPCAGITVPTQRS